MTPLEKAQLAFGSYREVARILDRDIAAILRLKKGTRNRAPGHFQAKQVTTLLEEAKRRKAPLTLADLVPAPEGRDAA